MNSPSVVATARFSLTQSVGAVLLDRMRKSGAALASLPQPQTGHRHAQIVQRNIRLSVAWRPQALLRTAPPPW